MRESLQFIRNFYFPDLPLKTLRVKIGFDEKFWIFWEIRCSYILVMFKLLLLFKFFSMIYTSGVDPTVLLYHPNKSHLFLKLLWKGKDRINHSFNWGRHLVFDWANTKYHFWGKFLNCFIFWEFIVWSFDLKDWSELIIVYRYLLPKDLLLYAKCNIMILLSTSVDVVHLS